MITDLLGSLGEYKVEKIEKDEKNKILDIYISQKEDRIKCGNCQAEVSYVRKSYDRTIRDLPIGEYIIVKIHYRVKIYECLKCRKRQSIKFELVEEGQYATTRFKLYVGKMATLIPPKQLAEELCLDDNTAYRYEDFFLKKSFPQ